MSQAAEKLAVSRPGSIKDAHFNWEDPLDLESQLTGDERMIRDSARAFCNDKLGPRVKQAFRDGQRAGVYSSAAREVLRSTIAETRANRRAMSAKLRWAVRAR